MDAVVVANDGVHDAELSNGLVEAPLLSGHNRPQPATGLQNGRTNSGRYLHCTGPPKTEGTSQFPCYLVSAYRSSMPFPCRFGLGYRSGNCASGPVAYFMSTKDLEGNGRVTHWIYRHAETGTGKTIPLSATERWRNETPKAHASARHVQQNISQP